MDHEHGYAEPLELSCARCGPVMVSVPTIIDIEHTARRAELVETIRNGTIHHVACPGCGAALTADAPLLVYCPGPEPVLAFSPAQATTAEQDRAAAEALVGRWQALRGRSGSDEIHKTFPISRELLTAMLTKGVAAVRRWVFPDPGAAMGASIESAMRFTHAVSWHEAYRVVREHPEILTTDADSVHVATRERARVLKQRDGVRVLDEDIALLRRCQEVGVDRAFAEKLGDTLEDLRQNAAGSPPALHELLKESESAEQLYLRTGEAEALDRAAACWERVLFRPEPGTGREGFHGTHIKAHWRPSVWSCAATAFMRRHQARGGMADLDRVIVLVTNVLGALPEDAPDRAGHTLRLSMSHRMRYDRTRHPEDLDRAIDLDRQVAGNAAMNPAARLHGAIGLGDGLALRYEHTGQIEALDEAIALRRRVVEAMPEGSEDWLGRAAMLNLVLYQRYERTAQMEDLREIIDLTRKMFDAVPHDSQWRWKLLDELVDRLFTLYDRTGRIAHLEDAIALCRRALDAVPADSSDLPIVLGRLSAGLSKRHYRMHQIEDLEEAIGRRRKALDTASTDIAARPGYLNGLGTVVRERHGRTGRAEDLEEAIALFRRARAEVSADDPFRVVVLTNLGSAILARYESTKQMEDLQEGIALFRYNLDKTAPGSPHFPTILLNLSDALGRRYMRARQVEDLDEAIALSRRALDTIPAESPARPAYLKNLGTWLGERYECTGQIEDLTEANAVHREASERASDLLRDVGRRLRGLTIPKPATCAQCGPVEAELKVIIDLDGIDQRPDLADAIRRGAIQHLACPKCGAFLGAVHAPLLLHCSEPEPTLIYSPVEAWTAEENRNAAGVLIERWRSIAGETEAGTNPTVISIPQALLPLVLDAGVNAARALLAEAPADPVEAAVEQLMRARGPGEVYRTLCQYPELVEERAATLLAAQQDQVLAARCVGLLSRCREIGVQAALMERFGWTVDDMQRIDRMMQLSPSIYDLIHEAEQHAERCRGSDDAQALDAALACWERLLSDPGLEVGPEQQRFMLWTSAGTLFWSRYEGRGDFFDLERAVALSRQALEIARDDSMRSMSLAMLGCYLAARYRRTSGVEDLDEAITVYRRALDISSQDPTVWPRLVGDMGYLLLQRYEHTRRSKDLVDAREDRSGSLDDLDAAITALRQAAGAAPQRSPTRSTALAGLGEAIHRRYERTGRMADLDQAIALCREALDTRPLSQELLGTLTSALQERYNRTGQMDDLEERIALLRRSVTPGAPDHPSCLWRLGVALFERHERSRQVEDLKESITLFYQAFKVTPPDSPMGPLFLLHIGIGLSAMYERTRRIEDLHDAVTCCRHAVEAEPADSPHYPGYLVELGQRLIELYRRTGGVDCLLEATAVCRRAVDCTSSDASLRAMSLIPLGTCLRYQHKHTGRMEDLDEALALYRQAVEVSSLNPLQAPTFLAELAGILHERSELTGRVEDLDEAMAVSRQAVELARTLDPNSALQSAQVLGGWALQRSAWEDAAIAFGDAMTIVDRLCEGQLLRSDKHRWLRSAQLLYAQAAYSKARLGDLAGAALAMEAGRARVLTEMLDRARADLEGIETLAPELAHRYRQMLAQLRHVEGMAASGEGALTSGTNDRQRRLLEQIRDARAELHAAVEAIRATPGGASFLARPSEATLVDALEPGVPVIYIAATPVGGLALVMSSAAGAFAVTPLWLDSLTTTAVVEMLTGPPDRPELESWLGAYSQWQRRPGDREARARWHEQIAQTTRALWDMAMGPVVALLEERFPASEQAVLIPDGLLALLPLHAAWTETDGGQRRWAFDHVALSYAPSMRALSHARDIAGTCRETRLLVAYEPSPTTASPLPNSRHEAEAAAAQFAPHDVRLLAGDQCRRDDVLGAIADAEVCHFSCHGLNDWNDPLRSGLLMANDEVLTVKDLLALPGRQARLAILSACETGIVGTEVPNEVVALPAAFVQAGFAGVVASLWSVYDVSASLLMARFYELWRKERLAPAVALRRAQLWLRELTSSDLVAHLEHLVPELASRMPLDTAEALHLRALLLDPDARPFAHPAHWAAFCLTGV